MTRKRSIVAALIAVASGALALRLPQLDRRPMHTDEAVHAIKFDELWHTGRYVYDLNEYHGPILYYCALPVVWLSGAHTLADTSEKTFRLVPVLFGVGLILLLLMVGDGLGWTAALCAGTLLAVSPAFVFYSRYYIQEMLLVFFTIALLAAGWRYVQTRRVGWLLAAGAALGLMQATKETCIVALGCMAVALSATLVWTAGWRGMRAHLRPYARPVAWTATALVAIVVSALLYSAMGHNLRGPVDSLRAYGTYFARAGDHGVHVHPWYYYLRILLYTKLAPGPWWSEALILGLSLCGTVAIISRRGVAGGSLPWLRFLVVYTWLMTVVYSAISYKTPWSMLSFLCGHILLAGVGAVALLRGARRWWLQAALGIVLLAGSYHLGRQAVAASYRFCADNRNPYVYAQAVPDVVRLGGYVERLAAVHPDGRDMLIKVFADDPWPLPWYLRGFARVGYWENVPPEPDAPVMIVAPELEASLAPLLTHESQVNHYGQLPGRTLAVYVERGLYEDFVAQQPRSSRQEAARVIRAEGESVLGLADALRAGDLHRFRHQAMACTWEVFIRGGEQRPTEQAAQAAFDEIDRLENELSRFRPTSDVSRVNQTAAGEALRIGPDAYACLELAVRLHAETLGAFDVGIGGLVDRAVRGSSAESRGRPLGRDAELPLGVKLDRPTRTVTRLQDDVSVDLGGIGKGFAIDAAAALLQDWGVTAGLVHSGQSTAYAWGSLPGDEGWPIAVRDPDRRGAALGRLVLRDQALSGSGALLHGPHIIDPRTGGPAEGPPGAWALAPSAALADALSTAFMVLTPEEIRSYCKAHPDITALLLSAVGGSARLVEFGASPRWSANSSAPPSE